MVVILHFTPIPIPLTVCRQLTSSRLTCAVTSHASLVSAPHRKQTALFNGLHIQGHTQRVSSVVKASAEIDGALPDNTLPPSETKDESVSVEELPLESKLQQQLIQKTKMKEAKKARLKRKRLVRKRHLRKKGRWPPSKMKKNKNV